MTVTDFINDPQVQKDANSKLYSGKVGILWLERRIRHQIAEVTFDIQYLNSLRSKSLTRLLKSEE
ncbi:MAG: hypothetical protein NC453_23000, partial [Muribaculum sp.]|nr:hypothetical protein [Muribaculum sp.]